MLIVDVLHLLVVVAGIAIGAWSLVALRDTAPAMRFAAFVVASVGALFGCAALSGEVGLLPPVAWFAIVVFAMLCAPFAARRFGRPRLRES